MLRLRLLSARLTWPLAGLLILAATTSSGWAAPDGPDPVPSATQDYSAFSLEQLMNVKITSASLHEESLRDAPASVTVITAEEIRRFGYQTLADALAYVRGFYITSDHTFTYAGVRGFSLPGDFNTRIIVMIDGHNIADNLSGSNWFGQDFPLDLNLVERIEIIRGPSSALYGSSGMLGTINVVTRRPERATGTEVRIEAGSGERKIGANTAVALGKGANLLFSTSIFNDPGAHQLYFSEFDSPQTNFGNAIDMDGEKGYHVFADLKWGNWEAMAVAGDRVKIQPISWANTIFNDRGTRIEDSRGFFDLSYTKNFLGDRTLTWHTSYDEFRYRGIYRYLLSDDTVEDNRERDYGDWLGSKLTYRMPDSNTGHLTLGADVQIDLRASEDVFDVKPEKREIISDSLPDRYVGLFAQQEWSWGRHWEMNLGARMDWSWLKRYSVSPRTALIYKPTPKTDVKVLYGRGFRNPSSYEMYYSDNATQIANLSLRPETNDTYEVDAEHDFTKRLRAGASMYMYRVNDLIEQIYTPTGLAQFVNADHVKATGASVELTCILPKAVELTSSVEIQRAVLGSGAILPNSPGQVGKLHLTVPMWRDHLTVAGGLQALGQRETFDRVTLPWYILPEIVVSAKRLPAGLELAAGIRNLSNTFYRDPAGLNNSIDSIIGEGRTYYLNVTWHSPERPGIPRAKGAQVQTAAPTDSGR